MKKKKLSEEVTKRLDELKDIFVKEFKPERIVLFGSYARGAQKKYSSLDILIVARTDMPFYDRLKRAIKISKGDPPVEPLVYTPAELNTLLTQGDGFAERMVHEGILLYSK